MISIIAHQGDNRFLVDLGITDDRGAPLAQIADTRAGLIWPPMNKHSILARGYWTPIDPESAPAPTAILSKVQPA